MANLIQCSDGYICFESLINFLLSLFFLFYLLIHYRIILQDKNGILVQVDRILCLAALIQTLIQTVYFLYFDNDFLLSTIRCIGMALEVMICNILASIITDDKDMANVWLLAKGFLSLIFLEWFWSGIVHGSIIDYNCVQIDYLVLSSTGLVLALGAWYMGSQALDGLLAYRDKMEVAKKGQLQMKQYDQQFQQVTVRIEQINIMHYCGLLQFGLQFIFDLLTYINSTNMNDCISIYNAKSLIWVAILPIIKIVSFSTLPAAIFWIFYEKNKDKFNCDIEMQEQS